MRTFQYTNIIKKVIKKISKGKKISLHEPYLDISDIKSVKECIQSGYVSTAGKVINKFEDKIKKFTKSKNVIATVNGTAAIHVALQALGVKKNDEILMPSLNYIANVNASCYLGCIPHFIDVEKDTMGIDPEKLEKYLNKITFKKKNHIFNKKTKRKISGIIGVHLFGNSFKIKEVSKIAKKFNLFLLEDAAEAVGSFFEKKHLGTFGNVGVLSFNGNKIITSAGGGAVLTNNDQMAKKIKILINNSRKIHKWKYDYWGIGYNYKMTNLNASLGYSQIKKIKKILKIKKKIHQIYKNFFRKKIGINLLEAPKKCNSNYWLNTIYIKNLSGNQRDEIISELNKKGIQVRTIWKLLHKIKPFSKFPKSNLKTSEELFKKVISIPSGPNLLN